MRKLICLILTLTSSAIIALGQGAAGGGMGGISARGGASLYQSSPPGNDSARLERDKRRAMTSSESKDNGTSTFVDASVLMNVLPDEYVAVFGIVQEAKTISAANSKMDATIAHFKEALQPLGVKEPDIFVDFIVQNRIYAYNMEGNPIREELSGFELKKNVSIHYKDKAQLDRLVRAAAACEIFDLVKVDCVVKDTAAVRAKLREEAARVIKAKAERYQNLFGIKLSGSPQMLVDSPSIYYPDQQYASYVAAEAEKIMNIRSNVDVLLARKSRTFFFNPLNADGFDTVINPIVLEPVVQFTVYVKVKYATGEQPKDAIKQ
jgi:uncharacterized protein YggE